MGYVLIYLKGKWGAVCNIDQLSADALCRQLGYAHAGDFKEEEKLNKYVILYEYDELLLLTIICNIELQCSSLRHNF